MYIREHCGMLSDTFACDNFVMYCKHIISFKSVVFSLRLVLHLMMNWPNGLCILGLTVQSLQLTTYISFKGNFSKMTSVMAIRIQLGLIVVFVMFYQICFFFIPKVILQDINDDFRSSVQFLMVHINPLFDSYHLNN